MAVLRILVCKHCGWKRITTDNVTFEIASPSYESNNGAILEPMVQEEDCPACGWMHVKRVDQLPQVQEIKPKLVISDPIRDCFPLPPVYERD